MIDKGGAVSLPESGPNEVISEDTETLFEAIEKTNKQGVQRKVGKPLFSYAALIGFAIQTNKSKKMTLSEIYNWILNYYPYYKSAGNGWKVKYC